MSTRNKAHSNPALPPASGLLSSPATWLLLGVLLLMAVRLTWSETLYSSLADRLASTTDTEDLSTPTPGLATIIDCAVIMALLAAAVAWTQKLSRAHIVWLLAILALAACAIGAEVSAPAKLLALAGTCDFLTALLAGWCVFVLVRHARLRPIIVAVLMGILTVWTFRIFLQRFVEVPDTLAYFNEYRSKILVERGLVEGSSQARLYEARLASREVGGFLALSNVFAAGQAGLLVLAAALALQALGAIRARFAADKQTLRKGEVPLPPLLLGLFCLIICAGAVALALSQSKGAAASAILIGGLTLVGLRRANWVAAHRRGLLLATFGFIVAGLAAIIGYGMARHGLPTRSLLFRWHYWVGSIPMIQEHPWLGVGLNNFGGYYSQFKLALSPEDPKDPHNFFVRIATEAGLPAAALIMALIVWAFWRAARRDFLRDSAPPPSSLGEMLAIGGVFSALVFIIRIPFAERMDQLYTFELSTIYALFAFGGFALAAWAMSVITLPKSRSIFTAAAAAAGAILLYDQVNMAAVTGSVAMMFWILLALGQPEDAPFAAMPRAGRWFAPLFAVAAVGLFASTSLKLAAGTHPWNVDSLDTQIQQALEDQDLPKAETLVDRALAVDARSSELLMNRLRIRFALHEPIADLIHEILAQQPNNSQLRVAIVELVGDTPSDWPMSQRITALRRALEINDQLAWLDARTRDPVRMTDEQLERVRNLLATLQAASQP